MGEGWAEGGTGDVLFIYRVPWYLEYWPHLLMEGGALLLKGIECA